MGCCQSEPVYGPADPFIAHKIHIPIDRYRLNPVPVEGYMLFPNGDKITGVFNTDWGFPWKGQITKNGKTQDAHSVSIRTLMEIPT